MVVSRGLVISGAVLAFLGFLLVVASVASRLGSVAGAGLVVGGVGVVLFTVGLGIYVLAPAFDPLRARRGYGSYTTVIACTVLAAIIANVLAGLYFVASIVGHGGSLALGDIGLELRAISSSPSSLVVTTILTELSLLLVLVLRIVRPGVITWSDMGLTRQALGRRIAWGIGGGIGLILLAALVELALRQVGVRQTQSQSFLPLQQASLGLYVFFVIVGSVFVPLVEESFFRGYVFLALLQQKGTWQAFLVSALLFAAVHLNAAALLPIFIIALGFAFIFWRNKSTVPSIIAHGLNNLLAFLALRLTT